MPNKPARRNDPYKKIKTGSWTKWGGGRYGLIHSNSEETWYCQSCGQEQPKELPGFMLSVESGEYVKVCSCCFATARKIEYSYTRIIKIVRTC